MKDYYIMEYMYRDASNFKAFGQLLLTGKISDAVADEVESYLDSGVFFVAEQVGIPTLYSQLWKYSNGPTIADHAFHEFVEIRSATDEEVASLIIWGDIAILLSAFRNVKRHWDCSQSIHCASI